jgi:hypothetical protein
MPMQPDFQLIQLRGTPNASGSDAERGTTAAEPERATIAPRAARQAGRDNMSVRNEVMGNDAGWYRTR